MRRFTVAVLVLFATVLGIPPGVLAQEAPDYTAVDPSTDFEALEGATVYSGIDDNGAAWRIEVPDDWNGRLVLYAHGFVNPTTPELQVQNPALREFLISQGYAWAASSYRANGYGVVGDAVDDTFNLINYVEDETGTTPTQVLIHGASLGGHVTAASIERYPDAYDGALPICGVLGDTALFQYFADTALTASAHANVRTQVPIPADYLTDQVPAISTNLGLDGEFTPAGHRWGAVVEQLSGGERPVFEEGFSLWATTTSAAAIQEQPFLLALYGGALTGGEPDPRNLPLTGNEGQDYQYDDESALSPAEAQLNDAILRYPVDASADPYFPVVDGTPGIPVLSLHTIGDLFVPFSMEQIYARETADAGLSENFVSRAIRAVGHCDFTAEELTTAFADLTAWVETGTRPEGDAILDPHVVADRDFGCRFTSEQRTGVAPCPAEVATLRIAGDDRIATAIQMTQAAHTTADRVVIARSDLAADALAAASYADGRSPILLSRSTALPEAVANEIERLGATEVVLLGGTDALSTAVAKTAEDIDGVQTVMRIAGDDRYGTARRLAEETLDHTIDTEHVFVVNGEASGTGAGWVDAAAVAGLAAFLGDPILLVTDQGVPSDTAAALETLRPSRITIVGGEAVVSAATETALAGDGSVIVERLAGADRYATSAQIVERSIASGMELARPIIATGRSVADALVAGPAAAADAQALVLVDGVELRRSQVTTDLLFEQAMLISELRIAGGTAAVDELAERVLQQVVGPMDD